MPAPTRQRHARRVFYGWIVVGATTVIAAVGSSLGGLNSGLFVGPMGSELGITRAVFGWAVAARQLMSAAASPVLGQVVDRRGARPALLVGALLSCLAIGSLWRAESGWHLVVAFAVVGVGGIATPASITVTTPAAKWFVARRGRAMAWVALGLPLGAAVTIPFTEFLIGRYGWRTAWLCLSLVAVAIIMPAAALVRRSPEDMGLVPDGDDAAAVALTREAVQADAVEAQWTAQQARRNPTFWRLTLIFGVLMFAQTSVGTHRIPNFVDQGIDSGLIATATSLDALAALLSTMLFGRIVTRFATRHVGAVSFLIMAAGVLLTILTETAPLMFVSMIVFGFGIGGLLVMQNLVWADYFGRANLGTIRGSSMPLMLVLSAAGPVLAGYVRDVTGSYDPMWWISFGLIVLSAVALALAPAPAPRPVETVVRLATAAPSARR